MTVSPDLNEAIAAFQAGNLDRARTLAEQALEASESATGRHLLGLVHCRLGDPASGVVHLQAASEAEPGNAAFRLMLLRALVDCGRAVEVLEMPKPPPAKSPVDVAMWVTRGEAAMSLRNAEEAAEAWSQVASATPADWRALSNLGSALAALERWDEAADALARAVALKADDSALRQLLGTTYVSLGRHEEAIAEFQAARRIGGPTVTTEVGLGRRFMALLRFDEAVEAFRKAYELDPFDRSIVHQFGLALERTNRLEELSKLLQESETRGLGKERLAHLWALLAKREGRLEDARALLESPAPDEDMVSWNALRAKVADELGDTQQAFEAAAAMNRAARSRADSLAGPDDWKKDAHDYRERQHQLARTITPEWAARIPLLTEPPPRRIAFLLGFPRSGTTLLDTFLLGHPQVKVLEETQLVGRAAAEVGEIGDLPDASKASIARARARYLRELDEHSGPDFDGIVIDKFPLDMANAPLIQAMFPGAPLIFAQRHPCDVVLSGFMQPFGMTNFSDLEDAADYYDAMMKVWTASREAMDLNVHTAVYEDLVRDPEAVLKPLIGFLGLEWDERILEHRRTASERGTIVTPSYDQVTQAITSRPAGRWKRYAEQMEPVLPILLPWAQRLGYDD